MIPYGRQSIDQADIDAVVEVMRSDFLTQGPAVPQFEQAVAGYCGAAHAVAVNSGTSALHVACLALGVGSGDVVWTSPITFVASANCALYCGAEVDFVDIDAQSWNMSVEALDLKLEGAARSGRLPKAVIPVHLAGAPCDMTAIRDLSEQYGFRVIEDASHAIGGQYRGEPVGNCAYSDVTVFSFHPVKIVTTGEGGMALTSDPDVARRMARLRTHGVTREANEMTQAPDGLWPYEQLALGFNYRMTDLEAALGLSQLRRIDEFVTRRRALAERYDTAFRDLPPVTIPARQPDGYSSFHLYVIRLDRTRTNRSHREVFEWLRAAGIGVNLHYVPVYRQPFYAAMGFRPADFPEAETYYAEAISLPIFPALTDAQQDEVIDTVRGLVAT